MTVPRAMKIGVVAGLVLLALLLPLSAFANDSAAHEIQTLTMEWTAAVATRASAVLADNRLWLLTQALWLAFSSFLVIGTVSQFPSKGFDIPVSISVLVRILIVQVVMYSYDDLTRTMYNAVDGLGKIYQMALIGTDEPFDSAFSLIQRVASTVIVEGEDAWYDVGFDVMNVLTVAVVAIFQAAFCVVVAGVAIWTFLGYTIMKLVGLIFVPFLLLDALKGWFEKWLALFMGFLLFGFFARVVLALALIGAELGTGLVGGTGEMIRLTSIWDALQLLAFYALCGFAIFRSGTFAATLTSAGLAMQDPLGRISQAIGKQFK